jgi:hypothetical protein
LPFFFFFSGEDAPAHDLAFEGLEKIRHLGGRGRGGRTLDGGVVNLRLDRFETFLAGLLFGDPEGLFEGRPGESCDLLAERGIDLGSLPGPRGTTGLGAEFVDRADRLLHRLVAEHHGVEHDLFRKLARFGFDHEDALLGSGHDEVEAGQRSIVAFVY